MTVVDEMEACTELVQIAERLGESAALAAVGLAFARPNVDGSSVVPAGTEQHMSNVRACLSALTDFGEALGA